MCACVGVCACVRSCVRTQWRPRPLPPLAPSSYRRACSCQPSRARALPLLGIVLAPRSAGLYFWVGSHAGSSTCERGRGSYVVTNRCGKQTALCPFFPPSPLPRRHYSHYCDISAGALVAHQTPTAQVSHRRAVTGVRFLPKRVLDSNYRSLNGGRITINRYFHSFLSLRMRPDYKMQFV